MIFKKLENNGWFSRTQCMDINMDSEESVCDEENHDLKKKKKQKPHVARCGFLV